MEPESVCPRGGRGRQMEKQREKRSLRTWFRLCPARHLLCLLSAAVIVAHLLIRNSPRLNAALLKDFIRPAHRFLCRLTAAAPFSVAELLIAAAVLALLADLVYTALTARRRGLGRQIYRAFASLCTVVLVFYGGFCLLWGAYFYTEDFAARAGFSTEKISLEQLRTVTAWFAGLANEYAPQVPRDENGVCASDRAEILARSPEVYRRAAEQYPCLNWPEVPAKPVFCSRIMSYLDFTGFFFPFTAEANVNTDYPPSLFASTVAHELAHQRGVAREQEANFAAVLACLEYGDPEYVYSACLLAYTHLGNALYNADRAAWEPVYESLDESILRDFAANQTYWSRFDTAVQTVSNTVYENFLYSYDQELGLKSYGACVDLLVNAYYETALADEGS